MRKLCIALMAFGWMAAHAQDVPYPPDDIKAKWVGKKIFARASNGQLVDLTLDADGNATVAVGNLVDSGRWRLWEKGYCAKWQKIRAGQEACLTVVRRGSDIYVLNADGSVNAQVLRNPE
ncbi:MAG TPA: hypothetical protein VMZ74_05340 [Ramlibacter sp.]|nr:hypothetical protein [Ramlibacter sp.]